MYVSPFLSQQSFSAAEFMVQYSCFTKKLYSGSTRRMRKVMINEKEQRMAVAVCDSSPGWIAVSNHM